MAKRSATSVLNHDNWNDEEEEEEAGTFSPLSKSALQNRVIKKAKRSLTSAAATAEGTTGSSPFAKFSGFSTKTGSSPFLSSVNKTNSPFFSANSTAENTLSTFKSPQLSNTNNKSMSFFGKKIKAEETSNCNNKEDKKSEITSENTKESSVSNSSEAKQNRGVEYYKQLKSLNESVLQWMKQHLEKNAYIDFTPVFNDYKKHLDTLYVTYPVQKTEEDQKSKDNDMFKRSSLSADKNSGSAEQSKFKFESKQQQDETDYGAHFKSNTTNTSTFSFGIKLTPTATSSNSPLGPASSTKIELKQNNGEEKKGLPQFGAGFFSKPFQSGADKPFTFATAPVEKSADADKEGEEYVPPKNDFVAVAEKDALYSKRCKLFFKKGDSFSDKGVGTLYLKSLEEKTQLLIRADTNLGNILLNIMLSEKLPMSRSGKNNVLIVCVPNPPVDAKNPNSKDAIPLLIRVKTSEEADELLEILNKYKS